jgi:hypothetical protein
LIFNWKQHMQFFLNCIYATILAMIHFAQHV